MKWVVILLMLSVMVLLLILIIRIVRYAKVKQLSPIKWGILLFLNWVMFELSGVSLVTSMLNIKLDFEFMMANPGYAFLVQLFGIGCGFLGYFITRMMMDKSIV